MDFKFKHATTGEIRTISLSEKRIQTLLDEYILRDLLVCDCEPIGETNVVECNCSDYLDEFELMEREAPNVKVRGGTLL